MMFLIPDKWLAERNQPLRFLRETICHIAMLSMGDLEPALLMQPTTAALSMMRWMCDPVFGLMERRLRKAALSSRKFMWQRAIGADQQPHTCRSSM